MPKRRMHETTKIILKNSKKQENFVLLTSFKQVKINSVKYIKNIKMKIFNLI